MLPAANVNIQAQIPGFYAMKWRMMSIQRNPMELVEVKGVSKRMRKPRVLTVKQYHLLLPLIPEPYRTMVVLAQCIGLRISEILGLQWRDIDFNSRVLRAQRGVVQGRVDRVMTNIQRMTNHSILPLYN